MIVCKSSRTRRAPIYEVAAWQCRPDTAVRTLEQDDAKLVFKMPYPAAQIRLLENKHVCRFPEAAAALRHFGVT
jgi:hypothetical protein